VEIDPPPSLEGALNATDIWALDGVTAVIVGADGVVRGVAVAVAVVEPIPFVAVTVNVYSVPFVKPVNVQEVMLALPVQASGAVTGGSEVTE
jgi:hypothetical protein